MSTDADTAVSASTHSTADVSTTGTGPTSAESTSTLDSASDDSSSGVSGADADCELSGIQWAAELSVLFGDWPPTTSNRYGEPAWDLNVACTYVGASPSKQGMLLSCDDNGVERQIELQYNLWPWTPLPNIDMGELLHLRAHDSGDRWSVLSRPSGTVLSLAVLGRPDVVLAGQSDYQPFRFDVVGEVCPVDACERQLGLDVTLGDTISRVFEGSPVEISDLDESDYTVLVHHLFERTNEVDSACPVSQSIAFVILPTE